VLVSGYATQSVWRQHTAAWSVCNVVSAGGLLLLLLLLLLGEVLHQRSITGIAPVTFGKYARNLCLHVRLAHMSQAGRTAAAHVALRDMYTVECGRC
jgi:hypothetical protein